jgi:transposase
VNHVAIDLGGRESQICIRRPDGTIVEQRRSLTRSLPQLMKQWEPSRVIVETSAEAFKIADAAKLAGHEVRVVPATLVRTLGVGDRGVKTDQKDAQTLSRVSCQIDLPSVHVPTELSRQFKSLCGNREELIECRTKLINNARGWLRTQLWRVRTGATSSFPDRVKQHASQLVQVIPPHIDRTLLMIEALTVQIRAADEELKQIASTHPICQNLMTVPGVGPVTAVRFLAAIDDVTRFRNAHAVQSYVGLTPGENSSSDRKQRTGITKAGPAKLRRTLVQAAWCIMRSRSTDPLATWGRQLATKKHKFVAVVALARKLTGILFAIWRDGSTYRSQSVTPPSH